MIISTKHIQLAEKVLYCDYLLLHLYQLVASLIPRPLPSVLSWKVNTSDARVERRVLLECG